MVKHKIADAKQPPAPYIANNRGLLFIKRLMR
jgi:hypothetical protein